jgi:hypothetical protein
MAPSTPFSFLCRPCIRLRSVLRGLFGDSPKLTLHACPRDNYILLYIPWTLLPPTAAMLSTALRNSAIVPNAPCSLHDQFPGTIYVVQ